MLRLIISVYNILAENSTNSKNRAATLTIESQIEGNRTKSIALNVARLTLVCIFAVTPTLAQQPAVELPGEILNVHLQKQLELLDSPDFRDRELAAWRLQQHPYAAINLIASSAPNASVNSASQQIALLDLFLSHSDTEIKTAAYDTLKRFSSTKTTALASMAASSVKVIEDAFERQAIAILSHAGANIGYLDININGGNVAKRFARDDLLGVEIKVGAYNGNLEALSWIRYLKSAKIVSLEGKYASSEVLALVAQMAGVKKILLRGTYVRPGVYETNLKPEDLLILKQLPEIEHLEIKYMSIDDSFVPVLCQLPITESLRLFGTAITEHGKNELVDQLDGLDIYRGNGGFLGIGSSAIGAVVVTTVQDKSAAENAGIQLGDTITEIQGDPIKNFSDLRKSIAKYSPDDMLLIKLKRPIAKSANLPGQAYFEIQLFAVLNEQAN